MNRHQISTPTQVTWHSQSTNSGDSMPCGGHDIGLNVWAEDGDLLFYIDRSGSFDENHQMLKLGRVRLQLQPNPFKDNAPFRQTLDIETGCIDIVAGSPEVRIHIWVETERPIIHVECDSDTPFSLKAIYENWRNSPREIPHNRRHQTASYIGYPGTVTSWPDTVQFKDNGVLFYHRNRSDTLLIDKLIEQQNLESIRDVIPDTQTNRTFGGIMLGKGLITAETGAGNYPSFPYQSWALQSQEATKAQRLDIVCHTDQTADIESWQTALESLTSQVESGIEAARTKALSWWKAFNERSYIRINQETTTSDDQGWQIGRNYSLFRYMLGCNAQSEWPSKFNGHLFTSDPGHIKGMMGFREGDDLSQESADFRQWGGGSFTAQNQRLVYWPLLKSGDADMMPTQFDYYHRALPTALGRVNKYWGHEGCCFAEQLENFGLPIGWAWGWEGTDDAHHTRTPDLDPTLEAGTWVKYYYETQLEFCYMILEYRRFQNLDITRWMPFIRASVIFFDQHYRMRCVESTGSELDANGKYVFAPTKALETYVDAVNPLPIIAALTKLLPELLALPDSISNESDRALWQNMTNCLPALPTREVDGHTIFSPAEQFNPEKINHEDPQMYAVFPYTIAHHGTAEYQIAQDTWDHDDLKIHFKPCWGQSFLWAARLGRAEEARALAIDKLADAPRRFPAFWGPGPDWVPDVDHGGSGMIGLQEMLMQTDGDQIRLLPAWPKEWNVDFKLHAPKQTTVQVSVRDGKILDIKVTPESRRKDVVIATNDET